MLFANIEHPLLLTFSVYFLVSFATQLLELPLVRLFESVICNGYYHQNPIHIRDVKEPWCKITPVQDELSNIVGWKLCFDALPGGSLNILRKVTATHLPTGLLTAIFYANVAEKYGRRTLVLLCIIGNSLMLACVVTICNFGTIWKKLLS